VGKPNKRKKRQKEVEKRMNIMRNNVSDNDVKQHKAEDQQREEMKRKEQLQQEYDRLKLYLRSQPKIRTIPFIEMMEYAKHNTVAHVVGIGTCPACEAGIPNHPQGEYDEEESNIEEETNHKESIGVNCKFESEDRPVSEV